MAGWHPFRQEQTPQAGDARRPGIRGGVEADGRAEALALQRTHKSGDADQPPRARPHPPRKHPQRRQIAAGLAQGLKEAVPEGICSGCCGGGRAPRGHKEEEWAR